MGRLLGILLICVLGAWIVGAAPAVQAADWTWHASMGIGPRSDGMGVGLALWAGVPSVNSLFVRLGGSFGGGKDASFTPDMSVAYFLPLNRIHAGLAARYPQLDPFVGGGLTALAPSGTGPYGAVGATYRLSERGWAWGELRLGAPQWLVAGVGVSL